MLLIQSQSQEIPKLKRAHTLLLRFGGVVTLHHVNGCSNCTMRIALMLVHRGVLFFFLTLR